MKTAEIFCDGACSGNPGPGGYACIVRQNGRDREFSGGATHTTNNKMELMAAIIGLESLPCPATVKLISDSQYLIKGMTEWIEGWQKRGWKNANKKPVLNRDLWERLIAAASRHNIEWAWIRGHSGHPENERCDALAQAAMKCDKTNLT